MKLVFHQTPFIKTPFYTKRQVHQKSLHQTLFTPDTFDTKQLLHQTHFTPETFYKFHARHVLHETCFTPDMFYTNGILHQTPFTPITSLRVILTMTFQNSQVRSYVSLIGSGEGRHTTHLLKCVLLLSTSQTDWTFFLTFLLTYLLTFFLRYLLKFFLTYLLTFFLTSF